MSVEACRGCSCQQNDFVLLVDMVSNKMGRVWYNAVGGNAHKWLCSAMCIENVQWPLGVLISVGSSQVVYGSCKEISWDAFYTILTRFGSRPPPCTGLVDSSTASLLLCGLPSTWVVLRVWRIKMIIAGARVGGLFLLSPSYLPLLQLLHFIV